MLSVDRTRADWTHQGHPRVPTQVIHPYLEGHHTGVADHFNRDPRVLIAAIDRDHRARGWNGIFYNLMVDTAGQVWECRGVGFRSIGAHRPTYNVGRGDGSPVDPSALTVLVPGDYRTNRLTEAQRTTLRRLAAQMPDPRPRWHGGRDATACPGTDVVAFLLSLKVEEPNVSDMVLGPGSRGEEVRYVQNVLRFFGALAGAADGVFGPQTAAASVVFKAQMRASSHRPHLLGDTPLWGPRTFEELGAFLERLRRL